MTKQSLTAEEVDALPKIVLTYRHRYVSRKGELSYIWADEDGKERSYTAGKRDANVTPDAFIGAKFEFPATGETLGTIFGSRGKLVGHVPDEDCAAWHASDRIAGMELQAIKRAKKIASRDPLKKALEPVRRAYVDATPQGRSMLIAWVVREISRGEL